MIFVDGMGAAVGSDDYWWQLMIINGKQFQLMTIADGMGTGGGDSDYYIHIDDN